MQSYSLASQSAKSVSAFSMTPRLHLTVVWPLTEASVTLMPARTNVSTMHTVSISSEPSATGTSAVSLVSMHTGLSHLIALKA